MQCAYFTTHCLHHSFDLMILPFADAQLHLVSFAAADQRRHAYKVAQVDAFAQAIQRLRIQGRIKSDGIPFDDMTARRKQTVCQRSIIGDEQQSGRIQIEPPCGEHAFGQRWEQIKDRLMQAVFVSADRSCWFVHHQI